MWFRNKSKKENHNEINISTGKDPQMLILQELIKMNKSLGIVIGSIKEHEKRISKLENGGGGK